MTNFRNYIMEDLETQLRAAQHCRYRIVVTDGVFSMDGIIANLPGICDLAEKYDGDWDRVIKKSMEKDPVINKLLGIEWKDWH